MVKNKVVLKERDVWSDLANFIGEMVASMRKQWTWIICLIRIFIFVGKE